jgi:hypothetical protein
MPVAQRLTLARPNPPASLLPGGGRHCATNLLSRTDTSVADAEALCPALSADPT